MKRLIVIVALVVAACSSPASPAPQTGGGPAATPAPVTWYHDLVHRAQCWITPQGGIDCVPDSQMTTP